MTFFIQVIKEKISTFQATFITDNNNNNSSSNNDDNCSSSSSNITCISCRFVAMVIVLKRIVSLFQRMSLFST